MNIFLKTVACVFITLILCLMLSKQGKDFSLILSIAACTIIILGAAAYLTPIIEFIEKLQAVGQINSDLFGILLKAVGIGLLAEITVLTCSDSGNAALGKALQILSSAVILWMSLPLLNELIGLVEDILVS